MLESLASVLLLLVVVALVLSLLRGGTKGVGAWLHSKYIGA